MQTTILTRITYSRGLSLLAAILHFFCLPCWYSKISVFNSNRAYSLKNPNHSTCFRVSSYDFQQHEQHVSFSKPMKFRILLRIFFEESINSHRRTRPKLVTWRLCHMVAWWQAAAERRHLRPARRQFRNPIKNDIGGYTRPRPVTWRLCRSGLGGRLQLHGGI